MRFYFIRKDFKIYNIRLIFALLAILTGLSGNAQKSSNFQFDLGLTQNYNGFFKLFNGILDLGAGYNHELARDLYGGFHFRMSFLNREGTTNRATAYKPGINLHYYINLSDQLALIPVASVGYAILDISNKEFSYRETQAGWNPGAEVRMLWKREKKLDFYVFGRFDYVHLGRDEDFTLLEDYRDVYLSSFGLGLRLKSNHP